MYTDIHTDFITKPLASILEDGIVAVSSLPSGIESFPISEYFFQSLFIRMTGASEQKMKCICWQLATDDYQYRYEYLNSKDYGECSRYESKKGIFKDLINQIKGKDSTFQLGDIWNDVMLNDTLIQSERKRWELEVKAFKEKQARNIIQKQNEKGRTFTLDEEQSIIARYVNRQFDEDEWMMRLSTIRRDIRIKQLIDSITDSMRHSVFSKWRPQDFVLFTKNIHKIVQPQEIAKDVSNLFGGGLSQLYNVVVYDNRNRVAHNTISYQRNLPDLNTISDDNYYKNSYFFRYILIIIMDEIFVRLYNRYRYV